MSRKEETIFLLEDINIIHLRIISIQTQLLTEKVLFLKNNSKFLKNLKLKSGFSYHLFGYLKAQLITQKMSLKLNFKKQFILNIGFIFLLQYFTKI